MAGRVSRSFALLGASRRLLGRDPRLFLLPLSSLVVAGAAAWLFASAGLLHGLFGRGPRASSYAALYALYAIISFVTTCSNATLVAVALLRLNGEDATVADGWAIVRSRIGAVIRWALLAATIGVGLRAIQERAGVLGRLVGIVGNVAWGLLAFFVLPVLLVEDVDVRHAIRRSGAIFRARWGEGITGNLTIGIGLLLLWIPLALVSTALILIAPPVGIATLVASFLALGMVGSALTDVFTAALYRYAVTGSVPTGFTAQDFEKAIKPRHSWRRRSAGIPPRPDHWPTP